MIITQITSLNSISDAANDVIKAIGTKNVVCFYGGMGAGKTTVITSYSIHYTKLYEQVTQISFFQSVSKETS